VRGPSSPKRASTWKYVSGSNASISRSRRTIRASVGVCTRPSDTTPPRARPRTVAARVAFIPTSQSASDRDRAAAWRFTISSPSRRFSKPSPMAARVIDDTHSRRTGLRTLATSRM
jgi:hypothetical protein